MGSIKKFAKFFLIWYSQQMAIPFWVIGHVHLHFANYHDFYEYSISAILSLNGSSRFLDRLETKW